jgi:hypothetical protein
VRARVETSQRVETHAVNGLWRKPQRKKRKPPTRLAGNNCRMWSQFGKFRREQIAEDFNGYIFDFTNLKPAVFSMG